MLEERIRTDLKEAMLARDMDKCNTLKMVLGEIPRLNKKADKAVTDTEMINIIRKLVKSELLVLEYSGVDAGSSTYIRTLEKYLPKMMEEREIKQWVLDNVDLSAYNKCEQAMGKVMKALKGKADGNLVRRVLIGFN